MALSEGSISNPLPSFEAFIENTPLSYEATSPDTDLTKKPSGTPSTWRVADFGLRLLPSNTPRSRIPEPPSWAENETSSSRGEPSDLTNAGDNKAVLAIFTVLIFSVEVANPSWVAALI